MKKISKTNLIIIMIVAILSICSNTMATTTSSLHTTDEVIKEAQGFIDIGKNNGGVVSPNGQNITDASSTLYNVLLSIGIFLSIAIGIFLGIKFMTSSAEDKAKVKEALIPYIVGCVIIFGAFVIWKLTLNLLSGIDKVSQLPVKNQYTMEIQIGKK